MDSSKKFTCEICEKTFSSNHTLGLGCVILPKVLKNFGTSVFPNPLALRTSPSEKFSNFVFVYYPGKPVEVLLYDLLIAILVQSLGLKKIMKELDYPPNFWGRVYWDFHDFPKKFWGLGAPPPMGPGTPHMPYFGVPGPIKGGAPRPQIFFGKSCKCQ